MGLKGLHLKGLFAENSFDLLQSCSQLSLVITNNIKMRLRDIYKQINRPVDSVDQLIVLSLSNKTLTFLAARLGPDVYTKLKVILC